MASLLKKPSPEKGEGPSLQVFDLGGRKWIAKADHERIVSAVMEIAAAFGAPAKAEIAAALGSGRPATGGAEATAAYFGARSLASVAKLTQPLVAALDQMIPGFITWLEITGFGDDKDFICALLQWAEALAAPRQDHPTLNRATSRILTIA